MHVLAGRAMLKIAAIVLLLLWALGLVTGQMFGGFLHVLLVLALVLWMITVVKDGNIV
jgi:hypothetical protein